MNVLLGFFWCFVAGLLLRAGWFLTLNSWQGTALCIAAVIIFGFGAGAVFKRFPLV